MSIRRFTLLAMPALAALALTPQPPRASASLRSGAIVDSLRILYIGRPAGWEHYELTPTENGWRLTSDYDYVDRGRRNRTQLAMVVDTAYAVKTFEIARVT